MIKTAGVAAFYTVMNVRYAALIIPTGVVAYLLQLYWLAWVAGGLLAAATAAEVALSIANGVGAARQMAQRNKAVDDFFSEVEKYANDWTGRGSEAEASDEGEGPDEGQAPVPAR
jgi:hypothetical protein